MMHKPELTFYCELDSQALKTLFEDRFVIDDLKVLNARLSLGILDFSVERAQVVQRLNKVGVPVVAWLLLPKEEGYWFNLDNYEQATARYEAFKVWTAEKSLAWAGIGLDIEPDINQVQDLKAKPLQLLPEVFKRLVNGQRVKKAQAAYKALVEQIRANGYLVEAYHLPLIVDERKAKSTVLQRVGGLVDLETDREVLMLYSSFLRPHGHTVLWDYGKEADSIAIGNTGGGVDLEGLTDKAPMTWEEFARDLRLAYLREKPIHIFCLEGCVAQGFLERLNTFDWQQPVVPPKSTGISSLRRSLQYLLWLLQRPLVILFGMMSFIGAIFMIRKRKSKGSKRNLIGKLKKKG